MLIPKDNERDLEEIDQTVRAALKFIPVSTVDEVFAAALCSENVQEEVANCVSAFVPVSRENSGDVALRQ